MALGLLDGEPRAGEVAADLDDPVDPDRHGRRERLLDGEARDVAAADVEVGVVVDDGDRERVGGRGEVAVAGPGGAPHRASRSRASSSSTTDSSSFTKTGMGLLTVAPTTTGRDAQLGVAEYSPVMTG